MDRKSAPEDRVRVLVAGLRASGDGYPNARRTMEILRGHGVAEVVDLGAALPESLHLWRLRGMPLARKIGFGLRMLAANTWSLLRVMRHARRGDVVYVPYPSLFFLALARCVPSPLRPRCVADAYISIWDADANDRGPGGANRMSSMGRAERFAFGAVWRVIVDTEANADLFKSAFELDRDNLRSFPLAVDADAYRSRRAPARADGEFRVVFVGTFIPLHGIDVILDAAERLREDPGIRFSIFGDGQLADAMQDRIASLPNVDWTRGWTSKEDLAEAVARSDASLGVFGGAGKASRVLPFKVYHALAAGKPVVTQAAMSLPAAVPRPPCVLVDGPSDDMGTRLAAELRSLAADRERLAALGEGSARYFDRWLSEDAVSSAWRALLEEASLDSSA